MPGRKVSYIRDAWRNLNSKNNEWKCLYCTKTLAYNITRFKTHTLWDCRLIPEDERKRLKTACGIENSGSLPSGCEDLMTENDSEMPSNDEVLALAHERAASFTGGESFAPPRKQTRFEIGGKFIDQMTIEQQTTSDKLLLKAMTSSNIPLYCFEKNPHWKKFFDSLRPAYKIASGEKLGGRLLNEEYEDTKKKVNNRLVQSDRLALISDGWSGIKNDSIINYLVATEDGTPYVHDYDDTGSELCNADYYYSRLKKQVESLNPNKVFAVVTDNASSLRSAKLKIEDDYPWIAAYGCAAHSLNLLMGDILKSVDVEVLQKSDNLIHFFRVRKAARALLGEVREELKHLNNDKSIPELQKFTPTRWNSRVYSLQLLKANRACLRDALGRQKLTQDKPAAFIQEVNEHVDFVTDDYAWKQIDDILNVLEPIGIVLSQLEANKRLCLGDIPEHMNNLALQLRNKIPLFIGFKDNFTAHKLEQLVKNRTEFMIHPVHCAANILHPVYKGKSLTSDQKAAGCEHLKKLSQFHSSMKMDEKDLMMHLAQFMSGNWEVGQKWSCTVRDLVPPVVWWKGSNPSCTSPLVPFALAVLFPPCSAAAAERDWSIRTNIHTKSRNRLLSAKVSRLAYVKQNIRLLDQESNVMEYKSINISLNEVAGIDPNLEDEDEQFVQDQ